MISVIIPAYNCERYLADAVESAAAQTYKNIEIIIIDDASADGTLKAANALAAERPEVKIRVYNNGANKGVAGTRNRAIGLAKGEYVAFLDADDRWLPGKLTRQLERVNETGADLCYTGYSFIDSGGSAIRKPYAVPAEVTFNSQLYENAIGLSTVLVKRSALDGVRMRREYAHEDYVFWLELLRRGCKMAGINEPLTEYRVSESNRSGNKIKAAKNRWKIYRDFLKINIIKASFYLCVYTARGVIKTVK